MKKCWLFAGVLALAGVLLGVDAFRGSLQAQAQGQAPQSWSGIRIACLDIDKVFQEYDKFKFLRDSLKKEIEQKETELKDLQTRIQTKIESLKDIRSQVDRDRIEKEVADLRFEFERLKRDSQQYFINREAEVYASIYKEVSDLVKEYCDHNGIHLVLRIKDGAEESGPQGVLQTITRQVVYHHANLDITQVIYQGLNTRLASKPR